MISINGDVVTGLRARTALTLTPAFEYFGYSEYEFPHEIRGQLEEDCERAEANI